jgi:hypothetical protein
MKYTFVINQAGVVRCGLLGRVDIPALCILDYLRGWFFCKEAKRVVVDGREFVWLRYEYAVEELPLLFNPQATVESRKNQLTRLVRGLREAGLVESVKVGRDLYLRPSDLAEALTSSRERTVTKSAPTVTPSHDDTVTSPHDDTTTPLRDDSRLTIIDETTISETTIKEPIPHSPPKGDCLNGTVSTSTSTQEEEIYAAYPKKVGKPAALRAIRRAITRHTLEIVLKRTRLYAQTYDGPVDYIPNPATFFNQDRFNDDPATWRRTARPGRPGGYVPLRKLDSANYQQPVEKF